MSIPTSSHPKSAPFYSFLLRYSQRGCQKGIKGGKNAPDANHFLPFSLPSNIGNELRPASPFYAVLQFRHCDAPFLLDTALPSAFVSIRCIVYSEPQTRYISFPSTATACAVMALAFAGVKKGFGVIFDQLYVHPSEYLLYVCWTGIREKPVVTIRLGVNP
jgi:hypothetical protein